MPIKIVCMNGAMERFRAVTIHTHAMCSICADFGVVVPEYVANNILRYNYIRARHVTDKVLSVPNTPLSHANYTRTHAVLFHFIVMLRERA